MNSFPLTILTPMGVVYEGNVSQAYLPSRRGPLGILFGHTPVLAPLSEKPAIMQIVDEAGVRKYFVISGGAAEVKKEETFVLTEKCEMAGNEETAKQLLLEKREKVEKDINNDVKIGEARLTSAYPPSRQ